MAEFEPVRFGKYQLIERIAVGGMAEVFKAKYYGVAGFEKLLVIKKILPHLSRNPEFVRMFINEAKIAVSLNHANVVQVYDLGVVGDAWERMFDETIAGLHFEVDGEEMPVVRLEISSESHPFWTGTMRELDTDGKIDRFRKRYGGKKKT